LTRDLKIITMWAHKWKMVFNPDISKQAVEVIFSKKKSPGTFNNLFFNGIHVKTLTKTKHLGLIMDAKLSFEEHLEAKFKKNK